MFALYYYFIVRWRFSFLFKEKKKDFRFDMFAVPIHTSVWPFIYFITSQRKKIVFLILLWTRSGVMVWGKLWLSFISNKYEKRKIFFYLPFLFLSVDILKARNEDEKKKKNFLIAFSVCFSLFNGLLCMCRHCHLSTKQQNKKRMKMEWTKRYAFILFFLYFLSDLQYYYVTRFSSLLSTRLYSIKTNIVCSKSRRSGYESRFFFSFIINELRSRDKVNGE